MSINKRYLKLTCSDCQQSGLVLLKETIEVPEYSAPGECQEEGIIVFYEYELLEGNFKLIHKNPHSEEIEIICNLCDEGRVRIE